MKLSDIMAHAGLAGYAEVALVLFLFAFALIVWWVLRPSHAAEFQRASRLPLDDEMSPQPGGPRAGSRS
ncbi:MAG: cbb3-type cytochrome c oxidase subunit 3 [Gemmatimonadetes bacterium]|nr:cbb3-type cytochrome c oxidase subunit 3 [Gemmatimonadota bacterium]